jgi:amidase
VLAAPGLITASATELAGMIARGEASSVEVVRAHLERVDHVNPSLRAVVRLAPDALDRAREADEALARGEAVGPLHGVPFTVKDWIETADLVCDAGYPERRNHRPGRDATVVARMRAAGAVLIGKTSVREGAPLHPRPNNPVDASRTPGSSSSGEAAIIAAGGSPIGLGSDSGGSIRWPAHCCGVAGLKPSTGLVPNTGHFPRLGHLSDPRTAIGPLARTAHDLEAVLRVIAGEDFVDPGVAPVPLGRAGDVDLSALRVGWFASVDGAEVTADTTRAIAAAADTLAALRCAVREIDAPWLAESLAITRAYWARRTSASLNEWSPDRPARLDEEAIERSVFEWERFSRRMSTAMGDLDLLLSPVARRPAPAHGGWNETEYIFTLPYSLTGQPAAVIPFGISPEGLPIGIQLAARRWRDHHALAAAAALEAGDRVITTTPIDGRDP